MTITLIFLLVVFIFSLLFVPFARQMVKDKEELSNNPIHKKFEILIGVINQAMLDNKGQITLFDDDPKQMNLMSDAQRNLLIQFYYTSGNLIITLNYQYLQKELVYKQQFSGLRDCSVFMQRDMANTFVELCRKKMVEHQQNVRYSDMKAMSGTPHQTLGDSDPLNAARRVYEGLTEKERCAAINLLYVIGQASGASESTILRTAAFSQIVLTLNVRWEVCKHQFDTFGENAMYSDLQGLNDAVKTLLLLTAFQLGAELFQALGQMKPTFESKLFYSFGRIGYSEERVIQEYKKMELMAKMFG